MISFKEYLEEALSRTLPLLSKKDNGSEITYDFKTDSGRILSTRYMVQNMFGLRSLNMQFDVNMSVGTTGHNEPMPIFATVVENLSSVFKEKKPDYISFGLDSKREKIYTKLLKKYKGSHDISVYVGNHSNIKVMFIINNKTMNAEDINKISSGYHIDELKKAV